MDDKKEIAIYLYNGSGEYEKWAVSSALVPEDSVVLISYTGTTGEAGVRVASLKNEMLDRLKWLMPDSGHAQLDNNDNGVKGSKDSYEAAWKKATNKILIIIGDGVSDELNVDKPDIAGCRVLPVFHRKTGFMLSEEFQKFNAEWWEESVSEVIPKLLAMLRLSPEELKIFISYRRDDTEGIARQLYDALQHKGADAFLDGYSVPSGVDFQARIAQQLADKAMVVILESPRLTNSRWVMYEINFAKTHRLGFCAIHIDEAGSPSLQQIDDDNRYPIGTADYEDSAVPLHDRRLSDEELSAVVQFIKERHAAALFNKHQYLRTSLVQLLKSKNYSYSIDEKGYVDVSANARHYKLGLNIRPSDLKDFYRLDSTRSKLAPLDRVIIGPRFHEQERKQMNTWLATKAGISFYDEGKLKTFVDNLDQAK